KDVPLAGAGRPSEPLVELLKDVPLAGAGRPTEPLVELLKDVPLAGAGRTADPPVELLKDIPLARAARPADPPVEQPAEPKRSPEAGAMHPGDKPAEPGKLDQKKIETLAEALHKESGHDTSGLDLRNPVDQLRYWRDYHTNRDKVF